MRPFPKRRIRLAIHLRTRGTSSLKTAATTTPIMAATASRLMDGKVVEEQTRLEAVQTRTTTMLIPTSPTMRTKTVKGIRNSHKPAQRWVPPSLPCLLRPPLPRPEYPMLANLPSNPTFPRLTQSLQILCRSPRLGLPLPSLPSSPLHPPPQIPITVATAVAPPLRI